MGLYIGPYMCQGVNGPIHRGLWVKCLQSVQQVWTSLLMSGLNHLGLWVQCL